MVVYYIRIYNGFIKDKSKSFHMDNPSIKLVLMFLWLSLFIRSWEDLCKIHFRIFLMCKSILPAYTSAYHMSTWCQQRTKEGVASPQAGVPGCYELLYRY